MQSQEKFEEIDFQKHLLVLKRRWIPAVVIFAATVTLATSYALLLKDTYESETELLISSNQTSSLTGLDLDADMGRLDSLVRTTNPLDNQVKIVGSIPIIEKTIDSLNLKNDQGEPLSIEIFTDKLDVEAIKGTDILIISYTDENPILAAKVANKITEIYINTNIQANRADALSTSKFIREQLPKTEASVRKAESELRNFKEKNQVIALEEEANATVTTITELEQQISQLQAKLNDLNGQLSNLRQQANIDPRKAVTFAELSQIPGTQKLLEQLQEEQSKLALERTRSQSGSPTLINLEERVNALERLLQNRVEQVAGSKVQVGLGDLQIGDLRQDLIGELIRIETERTGLKRQIATLSNHLSAYQKRSRSLPQLEQTQRELERQLTAAQTTYEALLTRLQEINVAVENQNTANARIISLARIPQKPVGTGKKLIISVGGVVGIVLGAAAAFGLDLIDRSIKTVKEAKEVFQYTLLGVIPAVSKNKNIPFFPGVDSSIPKVIGRNLPHFPVGDVYQMLQANLKFLSSDKKLKTITVTSSVSKEGKSEVATNLAVTMAQVGLQVLLVDADMRNPVQHHVWNLTNAVGLSNVIVDLDSLNAGLQEVMPNLHVITSGVVPPNPVALLDSNRMATLVEAFTEEYDFVIFDTPALGGTADAGVLSKLTDGILLVVRPGVVDFASANAAKEFLTQSGQTVLGMVINGVDVKLEPDSYFYYSKDSGESGSGTGNPANRQAFPRALNHRAP